MFVLLEVEDVTVAHLQQQILRTMEHWRKSSHNIQELFVTVVCENP